MLLSEIKSIYHKELDDIYPKEEVDSFFYILIEHYLGLERFVLAIQPKLIVTKQEEQPLFEALSELKLQRPIQYIIGKAHFMDMDFLVSENVLIPRQETEELVRWIIQEVRNTENHTRDKTLKILDIGTGSGCIAIALAKNLPNAKVYALDISEKALVVARRNALANDVKIEFIKADILKFNTLTKFNTEFDIIVSNPPYVRESEKKEMQKNVLVYEPKTALYVSDDNPLLFYKSISEFTLKNLSEGGTLFLEINQYLGKEIISLLHEHNFSEIELRKDLFGNDRMISCKQC